MFPLQTPLVEFVGTQVLLNQLVRPAHSMQSLINGPVQVVHVFGQEQHVWLTDGPTCNGHGAELLL